MKRGLSIAAAAVLLTLVVFIGAIAIYVVVSGISTEERTIRTVSVKIEGVTTDGMGVGPEGVGPIIKLYVRGVRGSITVDRVYIVDASGNVVYVKKLDKPITIAPGRVTEIGFLIPLSVLERIQSMSEATIKLASATGSSTVLTVPPESLVSHESQALLTGFKFVVINCSDARSWWVDAGKIVNVIKSMISKGYRVDYVIINSTEQLEQFIENPANFEEKDWSGAIVINAHGEVVPIPSDYVNTTTNEPLWEEWYTDIRKAIENYGLIWVSVVGYPFFYVSNTHFNWTVQNRPSGVWEVGSKGLNHILGTEADCWAGKEWRIMIGNRSYHDFKDNSVVVHRTDTGSDFEDTIYKLVTGKSLPSELSCGRAFNAVGISVLYPIYENSDTSISREMLIAYDNFSADTIDPDKVDPTGFGYWNISNISGYSISNSILTLYPGTRLTKAYVGWADIQDVGKTTNYNFTYLAKIDIPSVVYASSRVFRVAIDNPYGRDLTYVTVNISLPSQVTSISGLLGIENLSGRGILVPVYWNCSISGCYAIAMLPRLPSGGATLYLVEVANASKSDLGEVFIAYDDFNNAIASTRKWFMLGDAEVVNGYLQLVPEVGDKAGKVYYVKKIPLGIDRLVITFRYRFSNTDSSRADGFVAMFFAEYNTNTPKGGSLGFDGTKGYGIEFDIYKNDFDPCRYHVALIDTYVSNHLAYTCYDDNPSGTPLEANKWHVANITLVRVGLNRFNITVIVDGNTVLSTETTLDAAYRYLGLSAATGGAYDAVQIDYYEAYSYLIEIPSDRVEIESTGSSVTELRKLFVEIGNSTVINEIRYAIELVSGTYTSSTGSKLNISSLWLYLERFSNTANSATPDLVFRDNYAYSAYASRSIEIPSGFFTLNISLISNSDVRVCIGSSCVDTLILNYTKDLRPTLGFYADDSELQIDWIKAYAKYQTWKGPRYCALAIKMGKGFLVLNSWSPPDDQRKEYGYTLSGIDLDFIARMAVLYPAYVVMKSHD